MTLVATRGDRTGEWDGIDIDVVGPGTAVSIAGRLDSSTAHLVRRALDDAVAAGDGDLVLDLRLAEVFDSAGLGVVVGAHRRAALAGRRIVIDNASPRFVRLARAARMGHILRP